VQLQDYILIFRKRFWIIVLVAAIAAGSALVLSKLQTPEYRSTVILDVWPARLDWGLQQVIKGLMRNWAGQITSRTLATEVINRTQIDITADELIGKLTVSPVEADLIIRIDADDYDPFIARDIAQTTAEIFVEDMTAYMNDQDKQDRVTVTLRDYALPGRLHKPKTKINLLAGGMFGVLAGIVIIFGLEWIESDILRTAEDVERHAGVAVLGVIPTVTSSPARSHRGK